jgi:hypothetical protein
MSELWNDVTENFGNFAGKWTGYAAVGSFLLYLFGYLTLRFQLSTYGVATNLDLFDEKYLFAGCRFLVYLVSSVPIVLIIALLIAAIGYLPYKAVPRSIKERLKTSLHAWCAVPARLPLFGIIVAVVIIQFVLRKCFILGNLLLRDDLPYGWIGSLLLASDGVQSLYFSGLVASVLFTVLVFVSALRSKMATTVTSRFLVGLLGFLVIVQFLLLPVNYGVLIASQQLPRVAGLSGEDTEANERNWLLWDSKDAVTYLSRDSANRREIVTVPRKDSRVAIQAYDDVFCVLFSQNHSESRPCGSGGKP